MLKVVGEMIPGEFLFLNQVESTYQYCGCNVSFRQVKVKLGGKLLNLFLAATFYSRSQDSNFAFIMFHRAPDVSLITLQIDDNRASVPLQGGGSSLVNH